MLDIPALRTFWDDHGTSILITLGVGFVFFLLGPIAGAFSKRRIRRERVEKVKDSLANLVEGMLVNQEDISGDKLRRMFRATEREADVVVGSQYDLGRLLDDVGLRFQRSPHLDAKQKNGYLETLASLADTLAENGDELGKSVAPAAYDTLLDALASSIRAGDQEKSTELIAKLRKRLSQEIFPDRDDLMTPFRAIPSLYVALVRRHRTALAILGILYVVFFVVVFILDTIRQQAG